MKAAKAESDAKNDKHFGRILRFLLSGPVCVEMSAKEGMLVLSHPEKGNIAIPAQVCRQMLSSGLIARNGLKLDVLPAGRNRLLRNEKGLNGFALQHSQSETKIIQSSTGLEVVEVNIAESPLASLSRLKTRSGERFLDVREWRAGERLRGDFTRGQLQPHLGINWSEPFGGGTRCGAGTKTDLNDTIISARRRVERALRAVGPELSGVLLDICCFLKRLGVVETERGWPVRSAKVVLKTALSALARHYEPECPPAGQHTKISHWGAPGYRPSLDARPNTN